jgi:hypothetical protein
MLPQPQPPQLGAPPPRTVDRTRPPSLSQRRAVRIGAVRAAVAGGCKRLCSPCQRGSVGTQSQSQSETIVDCVQLLFPLQDFNESSRSSSLEVLHLQLNVSSKSVPVPRSGLEGRDSSCNESGPWSVGTLVLYCK